MREAFLDGEFKNVRRRPGGGGLSALCINLLSMQRALDIYMPNEHDRYLLDIRKRCRYHCGYPQLNHYGFYDILPTF